jgi:putative tricarboxylic transport membrane protein
MAGLGLLTGFIGLDPRTAELRYTFGADYLQDGLDVMPVFLGMFAVTEMIELLASGKATISGKTSIGALSGSVREGVGAVFRHAGLTIRSSVLGSVVGLIPGVGGAVASFVAYGHAMRHAGRGQESFGRGDIRGVLAPEAANDAKDGAALIPTLFLGIPGSAGTAMLLVVLALHGLSPGPDLLDSQLTLVFVLVWSLFLSNWLTSILGLAVVTPLTRLSVIRTHLLLPPILSLIVVAAIIYGGRIEDVFVAFGVGVGGYYLKKYGWPRLPFVIALVLGPLFERHFMIYLQLRDLERISFWREPFAIGLAGLLVASLLWPGLRRLNMDARR